jgi:hypothetical protein
MPKYDAICGNQTETIEAPGVYEARLKAAAIFQSIFSRKVEGYEISVREVGPDGEWLTDLQSHAAAGRKVYIIKGEVLDPEAHGGRGKLGDIEWRFTSDDPSGLVNSSEDYLDLAEGMLNYPGAVFQMWDDEALAEPVVEEEREREVEISGEALEAVTKVTLSFIVTHSLHTEVTNENLARLVREHVNLRSDADLARQIDSHELLELVAEDFAGRRVLYRAKKDA